MALLVFVDFFAGLLADDDFTEAFALKAGFEVDFFAGLLADDDFDEAFALAAGFEVDFFAGPLADDDLDEAFALAAGFDFAFATGFEAVFFTAEADFEAAFAFAAGFEAVFFATEADFDAVFALPAPFFLVAMFFSLPMQRCVKRTYARAIYYQFTGNPTNCMSTCVQKQKTATTVPSSICPAVPRVSHIDKYGILPKNCVFCILNFALSLSHLVPRRDKRGTSYVLQIRELASLSSLSRCPARFCLNSGLSPCCQRANFVVSTTIPSHASKITDRFKCYFAGFDVFCRFCRFVYSKSS